MSDFDPAALQQQAQTLLASGMTEQQVIETMDGELVADNYRGPLGHRVHPPYDPTPEEIAERARRFRIGRLVEQHGKTRFHTCEAEESAPYVERMTVRLDPMTKKFLAR
jgi:hypothetical protein